MTEPFQSQLANAKQKLYPLCSCHINEWSIADAAFKAEMSGAWLTCYMLRRFGWPNIGSDDYKNLCSWLITTPLDGLLIEVTPYLGGSNLHFKGYALKPLADEISGESERKSHALACEAALRKWWEKTGREQYTIGWGTLEGDEDELLIKVGDGKVGDGYEGKVFGFWRRTEAHRKHPKLRRNALPQWVTQYIFMMMEPLADKHPEIKFPRTRKSDKPTALDRKVIKALRETMLDLVRDTYVRDVYFTPFGKREPDGAAPKSLRKYANNGVGFYKGAGHTPAYFFGKLSQAQREKVEQDGDL